MVNGLNVFFCMGPDRHWGPPAFSDVFVASYNGVSGHVGQEKRVFNFGVYVRATQAAFESLGLKEGVITSGLWATTAFTHLTLGLDRVFFPEYRRVPVRAPLFVIGHPRSGTTFFHRLLTQTDEFATFKLKDILIPSLTVRSLSGPDADPLAAFRRLFRDTSAIFPDGEHETGAGLTEEEELLLMWRLDTQMVSFIQPLAFSREDWPEIVFNDHQPCRKRRRSTRFLRECFKRQLYYTGRDRIVAKMPYSTLRIKSLLEEFPDARFVYLVRSPLETIPSHLTLHRSFFQNRWGLETIPRDALQRYYLRRYRHNVSLYKYFHTLWASGQLPPDRVMIVPYPRLKNALRQVFDEVVAFAALEVSEHLKARVSEQARTQRAYAPRHHNLALEEFGLTRERIVADLKFVFDEFGFDRG